MDRLDAEWNSAEKRVYRIDGSCADVDTLYCGCLIASDTIYLFDTSIPLRAGVAARQSLHRAVDHRLWRGDDFEIEPTAVCG
jgi:hypothetical protein